MPRAVLLHLGAVALVLTVAVAARTRVFDLPHFRSDEPANLALAHSLDTQGAFTMRHVESRYFPVSGVQVGAVRLETGTRERGSVIEFCASAGVDYSQEVSHKPPLLPALLVISRRLIGPPQFVVLGMDPQVRADSVVSKNVRAERARVTRQAERSSSAALAEAASLQRYAAVIPFAFSLIFVLATYWLAAVAAPARTDPVLPLVAALAAATVPIEILVAHLIQPDTLASGLGALGLVAAVAALGREGRWGWGLAGAAGVLFALGALAKQTTILLGVAYVACELVQAARTKSWRAALGRSAVFSVAAVLTCGWFYVGLLSRPEVLVPAATNNAGVGWESVVQRRSWFVYPANLLVHAPLLVLGVLGLPWLWRRREANGAERLLVLSACALAVFVVGSVGYANKENRYLIPFYPLFAVLCALVTERVRARLTERVSPPLAVALVYVPVAALALRGWIVGRAAPLEGFLLWNAESLF